MNYVFEILGLIIIIIICFIHSKEFKANVKINKWFHRLWFFGDAAICLVLCLLAKSYWLAAALTVEHAIGYNQILNLIRGEKMFYINGDEPGNTGSGTDRVLKLLGFFYQVFWILGCIILILLQFKL